MIRDAYGYHDFDDRESWEERVLAKRCLTFLHGRAWTHAEGPTALFDQSVAWLRSHRVVLPGVTVLERLVASVREQADERLYATVARQVERADAALRRELSGDSDTVFGIFSMLATGSRPASPTWATSGSGAPSCPMGQRRRTGRWKRSPATRSTDRRSTSSGRI